ncbi:hypothetical protein VTL71DRAFT_5681 [Oculimacula yallundae]|uniref:Uncharacterized protein n=1 Tax=Oculimacula yallundae TaxID=86028 RepID=A0ABR4BY61_9HELO
MLSSMNKLIESLTRLRDFSLGEQHWQEPETSIGIQCNSFGQYQCWEADGPAKRLFLEIEADISALLFTRAEEIDYGEPVAGHFLMFGMYMIGRDRSKARPTLLFSHPRPKPRQRAKQFIKESTILHGHPKIVLAESGDPPMAQGAVAFRAKTTGQRSVMLASPEVFAYRPTDFTLLQPLNLRRRVISTPIMTSLGKLATISLVVSYQGEEYGVSVAHAFMGMQPEDHTDLLAETQLHHSDHSNDFAFDSEDDEELSEGEEEQDVAVTSTGSISSNSSISMMSIPSANQEFDRLSTTAADTSTTQPFWPHESEKLGELFASSINEDCVGLDWALIKFTSALTVPLTAREKLVLSHSMPNVTSEVPDKPRRISASNHKGQIIYGTLSPNPTMMRLPYSKKFQEVWTVRFEDTGENAVCGSWVYDEQNCKIYGQIIAGHQGSSVAYINPAWKVFQAMRIELLKMKTLSRLPNDSNELSSRIDNGPAVHRLETWTSPIRRRFLFQYSHIVFCLFACCCALLYGQNKAVRSPQVLEKSVQLRELGRSRETTDILLSCLFTILLCIVMVVHLHRWRTSGPTIKGVSSNTWNSIRWSFVGLFAPELVLGMCLNDWHTARKQSMAFLKELKEEEEKKKNSTDLDYERLARLGDQTFTEDNQRSEEQETGTDPAKSANFERLEAEEPNKPRLFQMILVLTQVIWIFLQVIVRYFTSSISLLEISSFAFLVCCVIAYLLLWRQSQEQREWLAHRNRTLDSTLPFDIVELKLRLSTQTGNLIWRELLTNPLVWGLSFGGFVLGAVHLAAWGNSFPTQTEQFLWRISSISLLSPFVFLSLYRAFAKLGGPLYTFNTFGTGAEGLLSLLPLLPMGLYTFGRLFLFFESVTALRSVSLPVGSFFPEMWLSLIPHL